MSPQEQQLLQGLFDRMRGQASNQRDGQAEQMIVDNVRQQPYAPYLLAQTVIVQDQALQAANQKLQQLEQQVQDMQRSGPPAPSGGGSFLSGIFGGGASAPPSPQQRPAWNQGGTQQGYPQGAPQPQGYAPPLQQGGPWGGAPMQQSSGGGSFLHGALGAAAGVAGGVLLMDSMRGLFGGHNNSLGIASGMSGMGDGFGGGGGGETIVNNYYGDSGQGGGQGGGGTQADWQDDNQTDMSDNSDYSGGSYDT